MMKFLVQSVFTQSITNIASFAKIIYCILNRNKQGNDKGTQYASVVFLADEKQKQIAQKVKNDLQEYINTKKSPYSGKTIVTKIHDATKFVSQEFILMSRIFIIFEMMSKERLIL